MADISDVLALDNERFVRLAAFRSAGEGMTAKV